MIRHEVAKWVVVVGVVSAALVVLAAISDASLRLEDVLRRARRRRARRKMRGNVIRRG